MKKTNSAHNPDKKLIVYLTAGYPDFRTSRKIALESIRNGADIIELGVPFSDPIADGKTIQTSSYLALQNSFPSKFNHMDKILNLASTIHSVYPNIPIYLMSYLNPLISYGFSRLRKESLKKNIKGFIIPDLNIEMAQKLKKSKINLPSNIVFMASPNSIKNISRLKEIIKSTSGFLYAVSVLGVTGARKNLRIPIQFFQKLHHLTRHYEKKLYAGFGISSPSIAAQIARHTDGVIVGSAIIDIIKKSDRFTAPFKVGKFCLALKKSITQSQKGGTN